MLKSNEIRLIKSPIINEKCSTNLKYFTYTVGKTKENNERVKILFFIKLNSKCQYDGYENLFVLSEFSLSGKFISEKIIGKSDQVFGAEEYSYFELVNAQKIIRQQSSYYENEFGEIIAENSTDTLFL